MEALPESEWRARAAAHRQRVRRFTGPQRERKQRGEAHPVLDFLFTYYSYRPARLEEWHPGPGVVLLGGAEYLGRPGYVADVGGRAPRPEHAPPARADRPVRAHPAHRHRGPPTPAELLRPARVGDGVPLPHASARAVPLRLGAAGTDAVVEALPVHCTHHDAFRFFTPAARPRNAVAPARDDQVEHEQPGCLHATMDLYKWAYKLAPATPADLVAECFELAADVRELDMRASPYDLAALGYAPVPIETAAGRAAYARAQADFALRAAPLRERLVDVCTALL